MYPRATILACLVLSASFVTAQEAAAPEYLQRLVLPTRSDSIGFPGAVVADLHTGEVFVPDMRKRRIAIFDHRGMFLYQIVGGDRFSGPRDLAVDPEGYILVAARFDEDTSLAWLDFDGRFIRSVDLTGEPVSGAGRPRVTSVALSPDGRTAYILDEANLMLWITDRNGAVRRAVSLWTEDLELEEGDILLGHVDVYADKVLVAVPAIGLIYVYNLEGDRLHHVGRKGTASCRTGFPMAAALDNAGRLIVIDQQRTIGMVWDMEKNRCLLEFSGIGRSPGALYQPNDIALDRRGHVYISQGLEGRVQEYKGFSPAAGAP